MPAFPTLNDPPAYPLDPDGELEDGVLRSPTKRLARLNAGFDKQTLEADQRKSLGGWTAAGSWMPRCGPATAPTKRG